MAVVVVEVPDKIANKFASYSIIKYDFFFDRWYLEEDLINIDWDWWNNYDVNMNGEDFLKTLEKEIIQYNS